MIKPLTHAELSHLTDRHHADPDVRAVCREVLHLREQHQLVLDRCGALLDDLRAERVLSHRARVVPVRVFLLPGAHLPQYQTDGAACADLHAHLPEPLVLAGGECRRVPTGVHVAIPSGYEWQIRGRSGMSSRAHWIATGTIDSDYRGEVSATIINLAAWPLTISHGDRIAQAKLDVAPRADWQVVKSLDALGTTERGANGYGSTGVR